jgi:hypothetical protein
MVGKHRGVSVEMSARADFAASFAARSPDFFQPCIASDVFKSEFIASRSS